jgi:hypothetical protein
MLLILLAASDFIGPVGLRQTNWAPLLKPEYATSANPTPVHGRWINQHLYTRPVGAHLVQ